MAEVAVLGAGFIGLSSAYWLLRDGHRVTLFDPLGPGEAASYGNAGTFANYGCIPVNNPDVFRNLPNLLFSATSPFRIRWGYVPHLAPWLARFLLAATPKRCEASARALASLLSRAFEGYREMLAVDGLSSFVRQRECLYLYSNAASFQAAQRSLALRRSLGVRFQNIERDGIQALEPNLAPIFANGTLFGDSWFLSDPRGFLQMLHASMMSQGLRHERIAIRSLEPRSGSVRLVDESGRMHDAGHAIICTGASSRRFAQQCGDRVPLDTERGYHVRFPGTAPLISRPCGWAERGFYMVPMDGGIRAAGTVELGGYGPRKNPALLNLITTSAQEALPALQQPDSTWLGFRPSLPDGLPVVGRSSASPRAVYAFGHQHLGVTLGGVTGSVVADLVAGRACPLDLEPYSPRRF
ncbi:FAD-binding oxidoreductase [Trinickia terrae]|uniref:FAD-binding oxidoreductase n=1 Tax=Trinickia terrae TaxID=2571161 RepID=A0A4U1HRE3_9BURK|nr:FAD-binding oxidoreductase [Trinickia terrae]TKC83962.1 FAD-binding oxidoreductase [Trinickia terrae]